MWCKSAARNDAAVTNIKISFTDNHYSLVYQAYKQSGLQNKHLKEVTIWNVLDEHSLAGSVNACKI